MAKRITAQWLRDQDACEDQVQRFEAEWPNGATITKANCPRAETLRFDTHWVAKRYLRGGSLAAYWAAIAPARAAHQQGAMAPTWPAYRAVVAIAFWRIATREVSMSNWIEECVICGERIQLPDSEMRTPANARALEIAGWKQVPGIGAFCLCCAAARRKGREYVESESIESAPSDALAATLADALLGSPDMLEETITAGRPDGGIVTYRDLAAFILREGYGISRVELTQGQVDAIKAEVKE